MSSMKALRERAGVRSLLSKPDSNPKVKKCQKLGIYATVLHLAPGGKACPKASPGCLAACLHFAGNPQHMPAKEKARRAKTDLLYRDRNLFMNLLALEIEAHVRAAARRGLPPAIRLNGTSDIPWEKMKFIDWRGGGTTNIIAMFPGVQFFDYTKIPGRTPPANYDLTFSESEINGAEVQAEMRRGFNIASVFFGDVPATHLGRPVIDGDEHDYRPADPRGVVVGLKAKGIKGKTDTSGFVQNKYGTLALAV